VAVLAGAGFLGGLVATTLMLPGGQQFAHNIFGVETGKVVDAIRAYGGPLGLINVLVFHKSGLNGLGRNLMARIESSDTEQVTSTEDPPPERGDPVSLSLLGGGFSILAGFVAIALAWDHASRTDQLWVQNQEMLSGGIGGLALVLVGVGLLIRDRLGRNHLLLARQLESVLGARNPEPESDADGSQKTTVRRRRPRALSRTDG
jgi:hypothetical protein